MVDTNNIYAIIGYVLCSSYRRQTLNSLLAESKTSREVADELGVRRQAITKAINELRDFGLVVADGGKYKITETGMEVITSINDRRVNLDGR